MKPYVNVKAVFLIGLLLGPLAFLIGALIWALGIGMAVSAATRLDRPPEELTSTRQAIAAVAKTMCVGGLVTCVILIIAILVSR